MNSLTFSALHLDALARPRIDPSALRRSADEMLPAPACRAAWDLITGWPGYAPQPLHALPALAARLGVSSLHCKDESGRFGLGSFKALGGAYAVARLAAQAQGRALTVGCATEGNHGRAVAWGAKRAGVRCLVFLHEGVSAAREQAIAALGAAIRRVPGRYDDAVRACARAAAAEGFTVVSDTASPGDLDVPRLVMAGYSVMTQEIADTPVPLPTHVMLQGGVGALAAAVMAGLSRLQPQAPPAFLVVEPCRAACLLESVRVGQAVRIAGKLQTVMAGMACGQPSALALPVIGAGARLLVAVDDNRVVQAMRLLARPLGDDPALVAGASGAAGLGGLLATIDSTALREAVGLTPRSRVLVINTEGATDPQAWRQLVDGGLADA